MRYQGRGLLKTMLDTSSEAGVAYTIEGLGRTGERSFVGIEPTPDSALDTALDAESRGVAKVTIVSSTGWKYSIAEFAAVTRRAPSFAKGGPAESRATV